MMGLHQRMEARLHSLSNGLQDHLAQIHTPRLAPGRSCPPFYPIPRGMSGLTVNLMGETEISG